MKILKWALLLSVAALLGTWTAREIQYRWDVAQRRHLIGSLWTFIVLDYCPRHHGEYPPSLSALKEVPEYNQAPEYWDRALAEIDLTAPGVESTNSNPEIVVLCEKHPDERGFCWHHFLNGSLRLLKAAPLTPDQIWPPRFGNALPKPMRDFILSTKSASIFRIDRLDEAAFDLKVYDAFRNHKGEEEEIELEAQLPGKIQAFLAAEPTKRIVLFKGQWEELQAFLLNSESYEHNTGFTIREETICAVECGDSDTKMTIIFSNSVLSVILNGEEHNELFSKAGNLALVRWMQSVGIK